FMGRKVISLWGKYYDEKFPIANGDGFIILGLDSLTKEELDAELKLALAATKKFKAADAVILDANSEEAKKIWTCREALLLAIQKSTPKMDEVDICVPINHIPDVLHRVDELEQEVGMRIPNFGNAGDGNLYIYICLVSFSADEIEQVSYIWISLTVL